MKIGIDCRESTGKTTGIGRFLMEFLKEAKKYKEIEFILFGNQYTDFSNKELYSHKKVTINETFAFWWDQIKLKNAIQQNYLDLFFSPYYKFPVFLKTPSIISIFDLTYLVLEPYKSRISNKFYVKNFIKYASKKVKKILTSSDYAKNDLIKLLNLPEEKIEVLYLSVSEYFKPQNNQEIERIKKKYNIDKKYLLYVGNPKPHKNLQGLINSYNLLPENVKKKYYLVLAGVSNLRFTHADQGSATTDYPKVLNFVPDNDLPALYSGAELFVFPSLYEGFGFPPLEAMACGCPVISSNTSSMPEILSDACLYFNPCDIKEMSNTMKLMIENKTLQNELRQKGLERVKLFTPEKMAKQLMDVFYSIAD